MKIERMHIYIKMHFKRIKIILEKKYFISSSLFIIQNIHHINFISHQSLLII
jgi:hypothetical protein